MAVKVLCVGRLRERHYQSAAEEYRKRLSRLMPVSVVEVPDEREPANDAPALCRQTLQREGERVLARIGGQEHVVALCVEGRQVSSPELADKLKALFVAGKSDVTFVIGGSMGLSAQVLARADDCVSMGRMTFPHQLARVMLLEQLYRAAKINAGERYHK